jgi:hypothetical protein
MCRQWRTLCPVPVSSSDQRFPQMQIGLPYLQQGPLDALLKHGKQRSIYLNLYLQKKYGPVFDIHYSKQVLRSWVWSPWSWTHEARVPLHCKNFNIGFVILLTEKQPLIYFWDVDSFLLNITFEKQHFFWTLPVIMWNNNANCCVYKYFDNQHVHWPSPWESLLKPHQNDQGWKGPCCFQRLNAPKQCQIIQENT